MVGKYRGAAAIIQSTCPKAVYVHCAAHSLNLCVVGACKIQIVKNMMGSMVESCLFFSNSPKCQLELEKHIQTIECTNAKKLVSLCKTRWVARIDALQVFFDLYPAAVVKTLEVISEGATTGWNAESCRTAESLMICITIFQFLMAYVVTKKCLKYTKGLTTSLQTRAKDKEWFDAAVALGHKVDAPPPQLPRCCSRQTARNNTPGEFTPSVPYQ